MDAAWEVIKQLAAGEWCTHPCGVRAGCGCADIIERVLSAERQIADDMHTRARRLEDVSCEQQREIERLRASLQHVRTVFRVNMLRLAPQTSHEEIDRILQVESR